MAKSEPDPRKRVDRWTTVEAKALLPHEKELGDKLPAAESKLNKALKTREGRFMWPEN